ncbi:MAG: NBR1-Ig-like domain-containing protein [Anaerolineales bacterium]|nr:NBR1-Ig-like domain-containing protein [Anaerolineales bacterium]
MKHRSKPVILAICLTMLASLACNISSGTPQTDPNAAGTAVAQTVQAASNSNGPAGLVPATVTSSGGPTQAGAAQPTQPPPAAPVTQQQAPPPTAIPPTTVPIPCDRASFVKDMTVPDSTKVKAGEVFDKTWKLKNEGSCPWTSGYAVVFDHGDQMGAAVGINFTAASIAPSKNVDVSVTLTAPAKPGTYQGFFMLKNSAGKKFGIGSNAGQAFWVKIVVEAAAPASPVVYKSGLLEIPQTWPVDLDSGALGPASGADIHYQVDINSNHILDFWGSAKQMSKQPSFDDCSNAQMDSPSVPISGMSLGTYFCYVTDEGRFGYLEYAGSDSTPGAGKLFLEFTTWKKP